MKAESFVNGVLLSTLIILGLEAASGTPEAEAACVTCGCVLQDPGGIRCHFSGEPLLNENISGKPLEYPFVVAPEPAAGETHIYMESDMGRRSSQITLYQTDEYGVMTPIEIPGCANIPLPQMHVSYCGFGYSIPALQCTEN